MFAIQKTGFTRLRSVVAIKVEISDLDHPVFGNVTDDIVRLK